MTKSVKSIVGALCVATALNVAVTVHNHQQLQDVSMTLTNHTKQLLALNTLNTTPVSAKGIIEIRGNK
ncbi:hypothetical protein EM59_016500 [Vibrio parahaemolyticus]|uniref:hypothetical protein n=1 Tax=Vibrio parahaemolyticus TaxID=670 RepID=UPI0004D4EB9D|nr:hypothetical protein [Vibrio parahaemolyticus]EGQ7650929.1 hypothetical protein [Vibrio parahaemolyticus]EGQ9979481.1 hypothetical protein [Vibrio parahaemolyticus]EJG1824811.1 hypothetical protein [Vibrio parahaemolyticus]ELB2744120.1 hypothetical protein [Vibrio parahaemolyticus]ELC9528619.1 hypothetical protein [Vibrio parahaemolyticus]